MSARRTDRLSSLDPVLAAVVGSSEASTSRRVAIACARWACDLAGLTDPAAGAALEALGRDEVVSNVQRQRLLSLVDELDALAWDRQEKDEQSPQGSKVSLSEFGRARAASALAFAATEPWTSTAALEAVYEAQAAVDGGLEGVRDLIGRIAGLIEPRGSRSAAEDRGADA